jgi:hypothetical protein
MDGKLVRGGSAIGPTIKVRFVGGPWHNRVAEVPRRPFIDVSPFVVADSDVSPVHLASRHHLERVRYKLVRTPSDRGTWFFQYVLAADSEQLLSEECHA